METPTLPRAARYRGALAYVLNLCEAAGVDPVGVQVSGFENADVKVHANSREDLDRLAAAFGVVVDYEDEERKYAATGLSVDHAPCTTLGAYGPQRGGYSA
jgi:uncharacterized protein (UPF0261 family)